MTDTELAIKLLPRLSAKGIAMDLIHQHQFILHTLGENGTSHFYPITDAQAIAYIVGCVVLRKRETQDGATPGDVLSCNAHVLAELGIIDKEPSE